jgi:hypothetical protein
MRCIPYRAPCSLNRSRSQPRRPPCSRSTMKYFPGGIGPAPFTQASGRLLAFWPRPEKAGNDIAPILKSSSVCRSIQNYIQTFISPSIYELSLTIKLTSGAKRSPIQRQVRPGPLMCAHTNDLSYRIKPVCDATLSYSALAASLELCVSQ